MSRYSIIFLLSFFWVVATFSQESGKLPIISSSPTLLGFPNVKVADSSSVVIDGFVSPFSFKVSHGSSVVLISNGKETMAFSTQAKEEGSKAVEFKYLLFRDGEVESGDLLFFEKFDRKKVGDKIIVEDKGSNRSFKSDEFSFTWSAGGQGYSYFYFNLSKTKVTVLDNVSLEDFQLGN